ncbi:MAG: hypothetical protein WEF50_09650 [Myxococcota bacterium]
MTRLAFSGDVMLGRGVADALAAGEIVRPWGELCTPLGTELEDGGEPGPVSVRLEPSGPFAHGGMQ